MQRISSFAAILLVAVSRASAQNANTPVGIGFVNAVALTSKTDVLIDAQKVKPAGFAAGAYATGLGVAAGSHEFSCTNSDAENKVTQRLEAKQGFSPLYILYSVAVAQSNGSTKNFLKLTSIPGQPASGKPTFFAVSTLEGGPTAIRINGQDLQIDPLKLTPIQGTALTVELKGGRPTRYDPIESGNYVLVLFGDSIRRVQTSFVEMAK